MGTFVENSLITGEQLEAEAKMTLLSQALWLVLAVLMIMTVIIPIICVLIAVLNVKTTELAVTNKKIIGKTGWISRRSIDLPLNKLESFSVDQSLLGRLLSYGTVQVSGTGGHSVSIPYIKDPLGFKRIVMTVLDRTTMAGRAA